MARLDVRELAGARGRRLVVELQGELLVDLQTVIVAPLVDIHALPPISDINPVFEFDGVRVALRLEQMASVPRKRLGRAHGSLAEHSDAITRSLDRLLF